MGEVLVVAPFNTLFLLAPRTEYNPENVVLCLLLSLGQFYSTMIMNRSYMSRNVRFIYLPDVTRNFVTRPACH